MCININEQYNDINNVLILIIILILIIVVILMCVIY